MEEKKCNDEYFARCNKLYYLIQKAYINRGLLQSIQMYNNAAAKKTLCLGKRSFNVLTHICELIKSDLALTIWKIFLEENTQANNLRGLNTFLRKNNFNKNISMRLDHKYDSLCSDLKTIRKQTLAHDDITKEKIHINMALLTEMLDAITEIYNGLCDSTIDYRVQQILPQNASVISFNSTFGFWNMIQGVSIPPDNSPQEELQDV